MLGPCTIHFAAGTIWNGTFSGMGEGQLTALELVEPCQTNKGETCKVTGATGQTFPWKLTLTSEKKVGIAGIKLHLHLAKACEPAITPATTTVTGIVQGQFNDTTTVEENEGKKYTESFVSFNNAGGLSVGGTATKLSGNLWFGTFLTAKP